MSDDNEQLTAQEQAALDSQRSAPEPAPVPTPTSTPAAAPLDAPAAPEAGEDAEPPAEGEGRQQMVSHAALHQERLRRQEAERDAAELRRKYEARLEEVLKLVPQPQAPAAPAEVPLPDPQQNPAEYIVEQMRRLGASQQQIDQRVAAFEQQSQQQQAVASVQQRAAAMEADYRAANPEYDSAMNYLRELRTRQMQAQGVKDPQRIAQQISAEAFQIAVGSLQEGGNPAERLHRLAEASGWAPVGVQAAAQAAAAPSEAERLLVVQRGQEQSRGLSNVRGNGPAPMTAAKLLEMDDDAFLEAMRKSKDARGLMGA